MTHALECDGRHNSDEMRDVTGLSPHRRGFTLIELLVVISIVTLLTAVLLPALGAARDAAKRVVCASNSRQIAFASSLYLNDHSDYFPARYPGYKDSQEQWGGKEGLEIDETDRMLNPYMGFKGPAATDSDGALEVFHCPSDNGTTGIGVYAAFSRQPDLWTQWGTSYIYNAGGNRNRNDNGLYGRRFDEVLNPHRVIQFGDGTMTSYILGWDFHLAYWHHRQENAWANITFVDGHVSFLQITKNNPNYQNGPNWTFVYNQ